ncbi:hypothetical protein P7K49_033432, partial [Saguinus oedipus]
QEVSCPHHPHPRSPQEGASGIPALSLDLQSRPLGPPHLARSARPSRARDIRGPQSGHIPPAGATHLHRRRRLP